jgi:hypothetical protein
VHPIVAAAMVNEITSDRRIAFRHARSTRRRDRFAAVRARLAGRRGAPPTLAAGPRVHVRAGR